MGGVALARLLDRPNLICVDMGGTSFDVSLVVDGKPDVASETELEGFPLLMSIVNIHTIGAGGGSLAYIEAGGLRVGPQSAGADPGPACYGRGGTRPTVTDANLVLGRVDPAAFAGGQMTLDRDAAEQAVAALADELGLGDGRAGRGHLRRHQRQDGAGDPHADRREGDRAARLRARRLRRRRADARRLPGAGARHRRGDRAAASPARSPPGGCWRPRSARTSAAPTSPRWPTLDHADLAAHAAPSWRTRASPRSKTRAITRADRARRARARHPLRRPGVHADDPADERGRTAASAGFDAALADRFHAGPRDSASATPTRARRSSSSSSARPRSATWAAPSRRRGDGAADAPIRRPRAEVVFGRRAARRRR